MTTFPLEMELSLIEKSELDRQVKVALSEWALSISPFKPQERPASSTKEMGEALKNIRDGQLYRGQASNFYVYCAQRWGMKPDTADYYIRCAENKEAPHSPSAPTAKSTAKVECIYFLSSGDLIKIGFSDDVKRRINSIRHMSPIPLTLLGFIPDDQRKEHAIHKRFDYLRSHGEWFRKTPELERFVEKALIAQAALASDQKSLPGFEVER